MDREVISASQNILWHKLYQCILRSVSKDNVSKDNNKQMGPNQTYKAAAQEMKP